MRTKAGLFAGGFVIALIGVGALCGFAAVDLTTDRYMPGQFAPIFEISVPDADGWAVSFMGEQYHIPSEPFLRASRAVEPYRGILPAPLRAAQYTALALHEKLEAAAEAFKQRRE